MPAKKSQLSLTDGVDQKSLSAALELIRTGEISEDILKVFGVSREEFTPEMMALLAQQIEQVSEKPEAVAHPDFPSLVGRVENFTIKGFLKQYLEPLRPVLNKIYARYQEKTQFLVTEESDSKVLELGFSDSEDIEAVVGQKASQVPALLSYFNAVSGANSEENLALSPKDFEVTLREALDGVSLFQGNDFEWYRKNYAEVMQFYYTFRPEFADPLKSKKTEDYYRVGQYVAGIYRSLGKIAKFAPGEYVALLEVDKAVISLFVNHENSDPVVTEYYLNLCDDLKRFVSSDDFNMDRKELETFYDYISLMDKKNSTKVLKDAKTSVSKKIALRIIEKAASYFSSIHEIKRYLNLTDRIFEELVRSSISTNKYLTKLNVLLQKSRVDALSALSEMNLSVDDRGFIAKKLYEIQSYLSANAGGLTSITKLYFYERSVSIYFNFFKCDYEVNKNINALLVFLNETRSYREAISNIISSMPVSNVFERNLKYQTVKTLKSIIEKFIVIKGNAQENESYLLYQMIDEIQGVYTLCKKLLPSNDTILSEFYAIKEAMLQKQQQSEIGEIASKTKRKAPVKQNKNQKPSKPANKKEDNAAEKPSVSQEDAATLAWKQYYSDGVSLLLASEYDAAIQKFREGLEKFRAPKYKDAQNHFNFGIADAEVTRFYKLKTKHIDIAKSSKLLEESCNHLRDFFDRNDLSEIDEDSLAMLPDFFANMLFLRSIRVQYDQVWETVQYRIGLLTDTKSVRVVELNDFFKKYNDFYRKTDEVLGIISRFRSSIIDSNGGLFDSMSSSMQRLFLYFDFMLFYISGKFEFNNIGPNINDLEHVFNQLLNKVRLQYHPYTYLSSLINYYHNYSSNFSKGSANHLLIAIKYAFKKVNSNDANFFQSVDRLLDSLVNSGFKKQDLGPDFASLFSNKFIFMLQSFSINKLVKCLECLMKLGFTYKQIFTDKQHKLLAHKLKKHKLKFPEPMLEGKTQAKRKTVSQPPSETESRVEESYSVGIEQLFLDFDKIQLQENNSASLEKLLLSKNDNGHHALHAALLT
ncbi:MAG: hypothetical protein KDH94_00345, partial [Coxiellaceae bacterium]|nr:hypothetical protein [Coxiellaceae bacterium]